MAWFLYIHIYILFQVYLKDHNSALGALDCTCVHISRFFVFYSGQMHSCTCVDALIDVLFFSWFVGVSLTKNHLVSQISVL